MKRQRGTTLTTRAASFFQLNKKEKEYIMAVSIADVQKLRKLTGAGLADCKKALDETGGDIEKAI